MFCLVGNSRRHVLSCRGSCTYMYMGRLFLILLFQTAYAPKQLSLLQPFLFGATMGGGNERTIGCDYTAKMTAMHRYGKTVKDFQPPMTFKLSTQHWILIVYKVFI